jgi:hypothetical protein
MSLPFAIEARLSKKDFAAFRELIQDRAVTVDAAMAWLVSRGYRIAHGSAGKYMRLARAEGLFPLRRIAGLRGDGETRRQLAIWADHLAGDDLTNLALYAVYLLNISAARRGNRPADFPGTTPMRLKGDRRPN